MSVIVSASLAGASPGTSRPDGRPKVDQNFRLELPQISLDPLYNRSAWTGQDAMEWLMAGNHRHLEGRHLFALHHHPAVPHEDRLDPSVVLISCIDARQDPQRLFDAPLGLCMIPRTAAAYASQDVAAEVQFSLKELPNIRAIVFVNHERCGMINKAIKVGGLDGTPPSDIGGAICDHASTFAWKIAQSIKGVAHDPHAFESLWGCEDRATAEQKNKELALHAMRHNIQTCINLLRRDVPQVAEYEERVGLVVTGGICRAGGRFELISSEARIH